jgi:hypothetical protein
LDFQQASHLGARRVVEARFVIDDRVGPKSLKTPKASIFRADV